MSQITLADLSNAIRFLTVDAVQKANSGHPGMPCGMADVATVLFKNHMKFSAHCPQWSIRDRFILSCGHGSMLLYALLYLTGYKDINLDDIKNFRQLGSPCAGHPEYGHLKGIETTTGPLGQGIANAVGIALSEKRKCALDSTFSHFTYVFASDGDMMEGISHEALSFAGHHQLKKLIVFYDYNEITIDGALNLSCSDDAKKRFESYHFQVQEISGHDFEAIDKAISFAKQNNQPSVILCHTDIGRGAPTLSGSEKAHGSPLGEEEIKLMRETLKWPYEPFEIPGEILTEWRKIGQKQSNLFEPQRVQTNYFFPSSDFFDIKTESMATRKASQIVLEKVISSRQDIIIGSADLTPSNNTKTATVEVFSDRNPKGQYVHFGIREHAMAGIMNGISVHGEFKAIGGTFLCFSDYMRPAIRMAAIMKQPVIYVFTHDSIGLGEDGPTHQPIEHLSALSAIPGVRVYRPCDLIETAECWALALKETECPSIMCFSRQTLPQVRESFENHCEKGAYQIANFGNNFDILATGSEVHIAIEVARKLNARVISVPCLELWEAPEETLSGTPRIIIEAGIRMRWDRFLRPKDHFFGLECFGASAPFKNIYTDRKLTSADIVRAVKGFS